MSDDVGAEIWFYHLESASVEETLPPLIEKCLDRSWRVDVCSTSKDRLEALDSLLWTWKPGSWLPHNGPDSPAEELLAPIRLITDLDSASQALALFLLDGAGWTKRAGMERIFVLFDGREETAVTHARAQWRLAKEDGLVPTYWRQSEDGKWTKNL